MSALAYVLAAAGVLLLWTAVTGADPRELLAGVFRGRSSSPKAAGARAR